MAKEQKNLPIDHKWKPDLGNMNGAHEWVDGDYIATVYQHQEYPKHMYHADYMHDQKPGVDYGFTEVSQVVNGPTEEEKLGPEWKNSPGKVGIITAPDALEGQKRKQAKVAAGANWRASLPGASGDITDHHMLFLQSQGAPVTNIAETFTFLAALTSQQMKSFMSEAAKWKPKAK